jgi:hypothetical protein
MAEKLECVSCDEELENDEWFEVERGEHAGEPVCADCYFDSDQHTTVVVPRDGVRETYRVSHTRVEGELEEGTPEAEYIDSIKWVSTDPWRGYYEGQAPEGWTNVLDTWFSPMDGYNIRGDLELFHKRWEQEKTNPPVPAIVAFPRNSNVCTMTIQIFIPSGPEAGTAWRKWLEGDDG